MRPVTVVVLSRYPEIFEAFRKSIETHEPEARKLLVRNVEGTVSDAERVKPGDFSMGWLCMDGPVPFRFATNANIGIDACLPDDVLLVNDDVTFNGPFLHRLQEAAYDHPKCGILSPKIKGAAKNAYQRAGVPFPIRGDFIRTPMVAFVCVYLKRAMIDAIGGLDQRYTCSWEDDDYCLEARIAGWDVGVTSQVEVNHGFEGGSGSETIKRYYGTYANILAENERRFVEKWQERLKDVDRRA